MSGEPVKVPAKKRYAGRNFAIGFGAFLLIGTAVFTYLASRAQNARRDGFEQMEQDGLHPRGHALTE
jgi:hypothetical protein